MSVRTRRGAGLVWVMREGSDDRLGPAHEGALDAIVRVPRGGVLVDVGAHVGHFTLRAAREAAVVVAFEPGARQREALEENLRLNGIGNVRVVPKAAWDRETRLSFRPGENGELGQSRVEEGPDADVDATTIDAQTMDLPRVDLVKIDVQGAEARALAGARETLARFRPRVVVELHDRELHDVNIRADVERILRECSYAWVEVHSNLTNDYLYAAPIGHENEFAPLRARVASARRWENVRLAPVRVRDGILRRLGVQV